MASPTSTKLVMLGNTGTGKSSITLRFVRAEFVSDIMATVGASYHTKIMVRDDGSIHQLQLWDTAGQERYRSLAPMYYRGAGAAVVVFDLTSRESFLGAQTWVAELKRKGDPDCVVGLAGNKLDLVTSDPSLRQVDADEAHAYAASQGLFFIETSAKSAANVNRLFEEIVKRLPLPATAGGAAGQAAHAEEVLRLSQAPPSVREGSKGGCC